MTSGKQSVDEARGAMRSFLVAHLRELASKADLEIDETRLTFAEELGCSSLQAVLTRSRPRTTARTWA